MMFCLSNAFRPGDAPLGFEPIFLKADVLPRLSFQRQFRDRKIGGRNLPNQH
jgi:hypothetical protein